MSAALQIGNFEQVRCLSAVSTQTCLDIIVCMSMPGRFFPGQSAGKLGRCCLNRAQVAHTSACMLSASAISQVLLLSR